MACKKKKYRDKQEAIDDLHRISNIPGDHKKPIRAYDCPRCQFWHLTSKPIDQDKPRKYKLKQDWTTVIKPNENEQ